MQFRNVFRLSPVFCIHNGVVVLRQNGTYIEYGLEHDDEKLRRRLERAARSHLCNGKNDLRIEFKTIDHDRFAKSLSLLYKNADDLGIKMLPGPGVDSVAAKNLYAADDNEIAVLLSSILDSALRECATDIHIHEGNVRFRKAGKLNSFVVLDHDTESTLVQRIKYVARLNVVEKRLPQDGQFVHTKKNGGNVFVRVSSMPSLSKDMSAQAEDIVLRLLDPSRVALNLYGLGFNAEQEKQLHNMCGFNSGLILICGPTGSGKSTTACAMLEHIGDVYQDAKKIISLEDPPEYVMPSVTQVHVNSGKTLDFDMAMRHCFRQDPDVLFFGEIRDALGAKAAVQSALTGHLVIATMHTGSVAQSKLRLVDFGLNPHVVDEVLRSVVVQHLDNGVLDARIKMYGENENV